MHNRLQSAMEYLMTYGWAILIIAVVLGALYQLGVFNSNPLSSSSSCLATAGFLCQTPVLNSSGYLAVKFGQIGINLMTVTNIACTTNTTSPTTTNSVNLALTSGATAIIAFNCPISSNSIGTGFKGYLWLTYSTPSQAGIVDRIAIVTSKVATTGNVIAVLGGGNSAGGFVAPSYLYCIGGYPLAGISSQVYYAPIYSSGGVGSWVVSNSYPTTIEQPACTISSGYIYCFYGYIGPSTTNVYSAPLLSPGPGVGTWSSTTAYPLASTGSSHGCQTSGGYVYCPGGYNGGTGFTQVYYASVSSGTVGAWSSTTAYPGGIGLNDCGISGGYIYCVAGYTNAYVTSVYSAPISGGGVGSWTATTNYPLATRTECVVSGGYIYCTGGNGGSAASYYASISSGTVGTWSSTTAYPIGLNANACSASGGYIYCVGGDPTGGSAQNQVYYAPLSGAGIGTWVSTNSYPLSTRLLACVNN